MRLIKKISGLLFLTASLLAYFPARAESFRPPSVPLVVCDPYFSIWSPADQLTDANTVHWTGHPQTLVGLVRIDGKTFRIMGADPATVPALPQTDLQVLPTRTIYSFAGAGVNLNLTFMTPALPQDLMIYSRPVTYLTWTAASADGNVHDVQVYLDAASEIAVNDASQTVIWSQPQMSGMRVLRVGSKTQAQLDRVGDDVRIDWGWLYLAADQDSGAHLEAAIAENSRHQFELEGKVNDQIVEAGADIAAAQAPVLSVSISLPRVTAQASVSRHVMLAYDDQFSIQYFGESLRPYWRRDGATAEDLLKLSSQDYQDLCVRCAQFDSELLQDAEKIGGEKYARICALAYRECVGGCKLVADANGQPLLFPKENFSNGCIGTVDVIYPMAPQFLLFGPSLTEAMLEPILDYGSSKRWRFPFAPHDLGTYPHADGQVYGGGELTENNQMPVEESGNMIILVAALEQMEGNADYATRFWPTLTKWAEYLKAKGFDPENQLCTDDFAGHLAHNVNLSAKAIIALGAYGNLCELHGDHAQALEYHNLAQKYAVRWMREAEENGHTKLAFDRPDTWSQKYNLVWDRLLNLNLFPKSLREHEIDFYKSHLNNFGLPLDCRADYTKLDWTIWSASLSTNRSNFEDLVNPIYEFLNNTTDRVPMTDWYMTSNARKKGFQARPVVGAVFLPMLYDNTIWQKWASQDVNHPSQWAALPQMITLVPAADRVATIWKYSLQPPPANWFQSSFNDSAWKQGAAGFGHHAAPSAHVGTDWDTSDIWLRREVDLPDQLEGKLALWLFHDDDVQVFVNGRKVISLAGWGNGYEPCFPSLVNAFKPGKNLIAIHCHQNFGGQFIDAGVVEIKSGRDSKMTASRQIKMGEE